MKPRTVLAKYLTLDQRDAFLQWLQANGCRWQIPAEARIIITGNQVIVPCWNIRTTKQAKTLWPKNIRDWQPKVKIRRFKIRHPLGQDFS